MKSVLVSLVLVILVIGLAVAGCAEQAPSPAPAPTPTPTPTPSPTPTPAKVETIELVCASPSPAIHISNAKIWVPWIEELEERTGGRVKVTLYHSSALGTNAEMYAMVEKGVCDIGSILPAICMGRFPLQDGYGLPYLLPVDARDKSGKPIRDILCEKYLVPLGFLPEQVHIMWTGRYLPKTWCSRVPIRTADDTKGLVIGIPGGKVSADVVKAAFLAAPETLMVPDYYLSMERGVIDACGAGGDILVGFKLWEVTKFVLEASEVSPGDISLWAMNPQTWASLPPDIQDIINEMNPKYRDLTVSAWVADSDECVQFAADKGVEVFPATPEMEATWQERTKHVADDWAKEMDARGLPGTAFVSDMRQLLAESQ